MSRKRDRKAAKAVKRSGGRAAANNNAGFVRSLAVRSVKSSRLRNVFVILTIVLSVSLLSVMALFYSGIETATKRQVAVMQHIIYSGLTEDQLGEMAQDDRTSYVIGLKSGQSVQIDGNMVQPSAYTAPLKEDGAQITTIEPSVGEIPDELDEVMLSDAYLNRIGSTAKPGDTVSFTWLDGTTETYVLSGLYHTEEHMSVYGVYFSEEYAREGSQLKDVPWQAAVCFHGADELTQSEFQEMAYSFGDEYGLARENMNINNYFLDVLPGNSLKMQQTFVIIGVGIALLFIGVLVIYSVFYLSVVGRIRQFGQLRTIGMTKRQIRKMVRMEGLILSAAGIPIGLVIGGAVGYALRPDGWSWINTAVIAAAVAAANVVMVLISVQKPAKTASSISPVEAAKYSGYDGEKAGKTKKLARKITPGNLAFMSHSRNRKRSALTMLSMGIGGILFMLAAVYVTSANLEDYARQGELGYGEFLINYSYNLQQTAEHGQTDLQIAHPLGDDLLQQIRDIDGVKKLHVIESLETGWESEGFGDDYTNVQPFSRERTEPLLNADGMEGEFDYDDMAAQDGIICLSSAYWEEVYGWAPELGDKITLRWFDGEAMQERTFTVMGTMSKVLDQEAGDTYADFLLPEDTLKEMTEGINLREAVVVETDMEKMEQIDAALSEIVKQEPYLSCHTLEEQMLQVQSQFTLLFSIMVGLSAFIIGFALINLVNTLITNILTRDHEFAMLQSVGMTRKQLTNMLRTEGILMAAGNIAITLVGGTAAGYAMILILRHFEADYMNFVFPVWFFLGYAVFIVLVPVLITECMVRRFQKRTLVERLREQ